MIPHLGQPNKRVEATPDLQRLWQEQIDLGALPNVWFDTSALPAYLANDEMFPFPSAERYLRTAVDRIRAAQDHVGHRHSGTTPYADYKQLVQLAQLHTQFLRAEERDRVLYANALQVDWT